jgi:hypothetical protein
VHYGWGESATRESGQCHDTVQGMIKLARTFELFRLEHD